MAEYIDKYVLRKHLLDCYTNEFLDADMKKAIIGIDVYVENMPAADVQPIYYAENVQNEVLNYLFNKEREAESMSYGDKRQERIVTIREIIRFVEDIDPRMDGDTK